jgi:hypothetical protein
MEALKGFLPEVVDDGHVRSHAFSGKEMHGSDRIPDPNLIETEPWLHTALL